MKVSKRQLRRIIKEEKTKLLNEQAQIPEVEVAEDGGTLTISPDVATEIEVIISQAFEGISALIEAIEAGGYPRSTRGVALDPRLEGMKDQLEIAVDGLYEAQMQANHLIANTGG